MPDQQAFTFNRELLIAFAGVLYLRHSKEATRFVKEWDKMLADSLNRVDQIAFNTLVAKYTTPLRASLRNDRLATGPQRLITAGVLPVPLFMNGHTYFIQGLHKARSKACCCHGDFLTGYFRLDTSGGCGW